MYVKDKYMFTNIYTYIVLYKIHVKLCVNLHVFKKSMPFMYDNIYIFYLLRYFVVDVAQPCIASHLQLPKSKMYKLAQISVIGTT